MNNKHSLPLLTGTAVYLYFMLFFAMTYIALKIFYPVEVLENTLAFIVGANFGMAVLVMISNIYANYSGISLPVFAGGGSLLYLDDNKLKSYKLKKASAVRSWVFAIVCILLAGLMGGVLASLSYMLN